MLLFGIESLVTFGLGLDCDFTLCMGGTPFCILFDVVLVVCSFG